MCGIFGVINYAPADEPVRHLKADAIRALVNELLINSELRGMSASGIAVLCGAEVSLIKAAVRGKALPDFPSYKKILSGIEDNSFRALIGHTRAPTKGSPRNNLNNHPIVAGKVIGVHNGMIANDDMLFEQYKDKITRSAEVDSEIIFRLLDMYLKDPQITLREAISNTTELIHGNYACAFLSLSRRKYLSLFCYHAPISYIRIAALSLLVFASTSDIIAKSVHKTPFELFSRERHTLKDVDGVGAKICLDDGSMTLFDLPAEKSKGLVPFCGSSPQHLLSLPSGYDSKVLPIHPSEDPLLLSKAPEDSSVPTWGSRLGEFFRGGFLRRL